MASSASTRGPPWPQQLVLPLAGALSKFSIDPILIYGSANGALPGARRSAVRSFDRPVAVSVGVD